jgi:prepilin-type N-terminal cleavage/methylation domain-containing protein
VVARSGFSLTETVVALALLSIIAIGVAGSGVAAAQMFRSAELHERALREGESILDSLLTLPSNGAGTRNVQHATVTWLAADSGGATAVSVMVNNRTVVLAGQR